MDDAETKDGTDGVPLSSATSPANSAEERVRRETMQNIRSYLAQLLFREKEAIGRRMEHQESVDLARLAIELAPLRGSRNPVEFLAEGARLLTEARAALVEERERPRRKSDNITLAQLEARFASDRVPYAELVDAGKGKRGDGGAAGVTEFKWGKWMKYTSDRGLEKCLTKHAERIYSKTRAELEELLSAQPPKFEAARDLLARDFDRALVEKLKKPQDFLSLFDSHRQEKVDQLAERLFADAKAGALRRGSVHSIWETRHAGNSARARKASHAKANKP